MMNMERCKTMTNLVNEIQRQHIGGYVNGKNHRSNPPPQRRWTIVSMRRLFCHNNNHSVMVVFVTLIAILSLSWLPYNSHNNYMVVEASSNTVNGNNNNSSISLWFRRFNGGGGDKSSNKKKKERSFWSRLLFRNGNTQQYPMSSRSDDDGGDDDDTMKPENRENSTIQREDTSTTTQNTVNTPPDSVTDTTDTNNLFFSTSQIMTQKRTQFLDRIAILASSIMRKDISTLNMDGSNSPNNMDNGDDADADHQPNNIDLDGITPQSDLTLPGRYIHIVTTAALPWFTGTAVNPLLRAAYLHRTTQHINHNHTTSTSNNTKTERMMNTTITSEVLPPKTTKRWVTLVIPWLELPEDQMMLYNGRVFANCTEQEQYIRDWLQNEADMADVACPNTGLQILFYPGRYHPGLGSIFAMGDIIDTIVNSTMTATSDNHTNTTTTNTTLNCNNDTANESDTTSFDENASNEDLNGNNDTEPSCNTSTNDYTGASEEMIPSPTHAVLDVCVLEEPEHCNWYRAPGDGWTKRFNYVVGIVHTNYKEYASSHYSGLWTAPAIALMSSAMIRAYCHKVIKLSNTLQSYAVEKESTSNVHGVRSNFWQEGLRRSKTPSSWDDAPQNATSIYFIGKLLWAKGLDLMLELEDYYKQYTGDYFPIDIYGSGPDQRAITRAFHGRRISVNANPKKEAEIEALDNDDDNCDWNDENTSSGSNIDKEVSAGGDGGTSTNDLYIKAKQTIAQFKATINTAVDLHEMTKEHLAKIKETINSVELPTTFSELRRQPIPADFLGRVDHGTLTSSKYRIFCNPSISEVLCTTTAEALAMGKYAIIPVHPSNTFFLQFPNCLAYRNKFEFVANLRWALTHDPEPLTPEQIHQFTWEAATERFIAASAITWREALERERLGLAKLDERIAWFHNELGKGETGDFIRKVLGAGPASHQVKYQKEKYIGTSSNGIENDEYGSNPTTTNEDEDDDEGDEDEDEESGFSRKFRRSSFAQAIRAAVKDFSSFGIQ